MVEMAMSVQLSQRIRLFSPDDVTDAQNVVRPVCYPHGDGCIGHWELSAYVLLTGVALHLAYADGMRASLQGIAGFIDNPRWGMDSKALFLLMGTYQHDALHCAGWLDSRTRRPTETHPVVMNVARLMLEKDSVEREAVIRVAKSFLASHFIPPSVMTTSH